MTERDEARMEPLLWEVLSSEPDIVAWLEPHEHEDEDEASSSSIRGGA